MKKCRIDSLGRIVIPIQYRKELNLKADTELNVEYENEKIVISKAKDYCRLCGRFIEEKSSPLCKNCIEEIKEKY